MPQLPSEFVWLYKEAAPKMIIEGLKLFGTEEATEVGEDNPVILLWAKEVNIPNYIHDSIAWCGLYMAVVAKRAGKEVVKDPLWAANWLHFGSVMNEAMFGDVMIFKRPGGNHVALYIAEDTYTYFVLGGNQGDMVDIIRIAKSRCIGIRRPKYSIQPLSVRKIFLNAEGKISSNES